MSSLLFNSFNQLAPSNDFLSQFNQFRSMFNGNPQAQVQNLINSGQMTQEQFNQYAQMANQLRSLIK